MKLDYLKKNINLRQLVLIVLVKLIMQLYLLCFFVNILIKKYSDINQLHYN